MHKFHEYKHRLQDVDMRLMKAASDKDGKQYELLIREYHFLSPLIQNIDQIESKYLEIGSYFEFVRATIDVGEKAGYMAEITILRQQINDLRILVKEQLAAEQQPHVGNPKEAELPIAEGAKRRKKREFSEAIKKVKSKNWSDIKNHIIDSIPLISEPGLPPVEKIEDLTELHPIFRDIRQKEINAEENDKLNIVFEAGVTKVARQIVIKHGIYLLHKSSHILSAAEIHCDLGMPSWSLSSAYQGAFLGTKAILHLLGLVFVTFENDTYLVDLWKNYDTDGDKIKVGIVRFEHEIGHRHIWEFFSRVLSSYKIPVWKKKVIDSLLMLNEKDFSKQRNHLNYWTGDWIFDDLHHFEIDPTLGVYPTGIENGLKQFAMKSDFSLVVAQIILNLAIKLLDDLSSETNALNLERKLLHSFLNNYDRHPIYVKNSF